MPTKSIKISEENYHWLLEEAAEMQKKEKRSISIDEAISYLKKKQKSGQTLLSLAGSLKLSDKEAEERLENIKKKWKTWKT